MEFVIEPYLFESECTDLELVEIEAAHAAAASRCEECIYSNPNPEPLGTGAAVLVYV